MRPTVLRTLVLAVAGLAAAACIGVGTASALPCNPDDPSCDPGPTSFTQHGTRTLTVTNGGGTVTGGGISCGATCSDSQPVARTCDDSGCLPWPEATTWTLTASYPKAGYRASWSSWTGCAPGSSCTASLGDEQTGSASGTVNVTWADVTAPSISFAPPSKVGPGTSFLIASASDNSGAVAHYSWWVDNALQQATGGSLAIGSLSAGAHSIRVQAFDGSGNGSAQIVKTVVIDRSTSVAVGTLPAFTNAATVPLSFTTDPDVTARSCSVNGGPGVACTSGWSAIDAASPDGTYAYRVTVIDDVGNMAVSAPVTTVLDRTRPALAFTDGPAEGQEVVTRSIAITFSQDEANPGSVDCALDGSPVPCTPGSAVTLSNLADGQHTFTVHAVDAATNERTIARTFGVRGPADGGGTGGGGDTGGGGTPTAGGGTPITGGTPPTGGTPTTGGGSPPAFAPRIASRFTRHGHETSVSVLRVRHLPASAKVLLVCKGKGKGCAVKRKAIAHKGGTLDVLKALHKKLRLEPGAVLELRLTSADGAVKRLRWTMRDRKRPKLATACAPAGGAFGHC